MVIRPTRGNAPRRTAYHETTTRLVGDDWKPLRIGKGER